MNDNEFIIFLCKELNYLYTAGDDIDFKTIIKELEIRNIDSNDIFKR